MARRTMLMRVHEWLSDPAYHQTSDHARDWYATIDNYETILDDTGYTYADDDCWIRTDSRGTWTATVEHAGVMYQA